MILNTIGKKIYKYRKKLNYSQEDLAKLVQIDRSQLSRIEQGKVNITIETLEKISIALKLEPCILLENKTYKTKPFVKWAGGKTQILSELLENIPKKFNDYYEPFIGGGALFFSLNPTTSYINDINSDLANAYLSFKDLESFENLKNELLKHEKNHSEEYYYQIRDMDREKTYLNSPCYVKAARLIYLNKACFNGLYRVNSKGYFNVPSGKKEIVKTFEENNFNQIYEFFNNENIIIKNQDFEEFLSNCKKGDFVYFDPPYDVLEEKNSFVNYNENGFEKKEQIRLAKLFKKLEEKGVLLMLSNHNTEFINELYKDFNIKIIQARRVINSKKDGRGKIDEVIITNY